jgi:hypothetical protein
MPLVRGKSSETISKGIDLENIGTALKSSVEEERWAAARMAGDASGGLSVLRDALAIETSPRVREALFVSLAQMRTVDSAKVILDYIRSDDASLRTSAMDALHLMPEAVNALIPDLLKDKDVDVRILACDLIRDQPALNSRRLIYEVLSREVDANVCGAAVEALAEIGDPELLPALQSCAARFPDNSFLLFAIDTAKERLTFQVPKFE